MAKNPAPAATPAATTTPEDVDAVLNLRERRAARTYEKMGEAQTPDAKQRLSRKFARQSGLEGTQQELAAAAAGTTTTKKQKRAQAADIISRELKESRRNQAKQSAAPTRTVRVPDSSTFAWQQRVGWSTPKDST